MSNPTCCDLPYPDDLLVALGRPDGLVYRADPRGPLTARQAIAAELGRWQTAVDPASMVLAASTSEAYSLLFKLLCDPGDAVMIPSPSYPLVEHLARLDAVEAVPFQLTPDDDWRLPLETLAGAPERTRAIVLVHPNNPTGHHIHPEDAATVTSLCRQRGLALIVDEVFLPYVLDGGPGSEYSFAADERCLTFTLGGFSKSLGLPQLKLAWIVPSGPQHELAVAHEGLDYVSDAYLSVSTPVALAAAELLASAAPVRQAIVERCRHNLESLRRTVAAQPALSVLPVGGGWNVILRLPAVIDEETLALELLARRGVAVQPGYLFDLPFDACFVLSLLTPTSSWRRGVDAVVEHVTELLHS